MNIFEFFKKIFCCGSSTIPSEAEPILPAKNSSPSIPASDAYLRISGALGTLGINTTVSAEPQVTEKEEDDDAYSLARTPTKKSVGTGSTYSSPGFSLGINTPTDSSAQQRRTPSSPGFSLGIKTPDQSPARSTHSSPGFSLGRAGNETDDNEVTIKLQ